MTWGSDRMPIKGLPSVFDKETKRLSGPQTVMDQRSRPLILQRNYGAFLYRDFDGHHRLVGGVVRSYKRRQNSNRETCVEGVECSDGGWGLKNITRMGVQTIFFSIVLSIVEIVLWCNADTLNVVFVKI